MATIGLFVIFDFCFGQGLFFYYPQHFFGIECLSGISYDNVLLLSFFFFRGEEMATFFLALYWKIWSTPRAPRKRSHYDAHIKAAVGGGKKPHIIRNFGLFRRGRKSYSEGGGGGGGRKLEGVVVPLKCPPWGGREGRGGGTPEVFLNRSGLLSILDKQRERECCCPFEK